MIPVEGHKHLYRDEKSGAIINNDTQGYLQYKKMRDQKINQDNEMQKLRSDVDEIKLLLRELINKSS